MKDLTITRTNTLSQEQKADIVQMWNAEYPINLAYESIDQFEQYLEKLSDKNHTLLVEKTGEIIGWFMTFIRDDEKWFAMILSSSRQKQGLGSMLLDEAKKQEKELNGWATDHNNFKKMDGSNYYSPLSFYQKNGFKILHNITFKNENLSTVKIKWTRN